MLNKTGGFLKGLGILLLGIAGMSWMLTSGAFQSFLAFAHDYPQMLPQAAETAKGLLLLAGTVAGGGLSVALLIELCRRGVFQQLISQAADTVEALSWVFDLVHEDPAEEFSDVSNPDDAEWFQDGIDLKKDLDDLLREEESAETAAPNPTDEKTHRIA